MPHTKPKPDRGGELKTDALLKTAAKLPRLPEPVIALHPGDVPSAALCRLKAGAIAACGPTSFWVRANASPRCGLEVLALAVMRVHATAAGVTPKGVEWWIQHRPANSDQPGLPAHSDKDEELLEETGTNVHPWVSTVSYLGAGGFPTLVIDAAPHANYKIPYAQTVTDAFVSFPAPLKHIAFDGRLLHAVTSIPGIKPSRLERVTFLANIWCTHQPLNCNRFPGAEPSVSTADGEAVATAMFSGPSGTTENIVSEVRAPGRVLQLDLPYSHLLQLSVPPLVPGGAGRVQHRRLFKQGRAAEARAKLFPKSGSGMRRWLLLRAHRSYSRVHAIAGMSGETHELRIGPGGVGEIVHFEAGDHHE